MKLTTKQHKSMLFINLIFIAAVCIINFFFQRNNFNYTLKCSASICFTCLGLINFVYAFKSKVYIPKFYIPMTAGIIFAMLGDIFIEHGFVYGAAAFAIGHIFFAVAYCFLQKFNRTDLLASIVFFLIILCYLLLCPVLEYEPPVFQLICIAYAAIISTMTGKAMGLFLSEKNLFHGIVFAGSFLFLISDLMLVMDLFADIGTWPYHSCVSLYYPSMCLLTLSLLLKVRQDDKKETT